MANIPQNTLNALREPMIEPGSSYKFHTFLGIFVGRVVDMDATHAKLDCCSWIADEGRMSECMANGAKACKEIEFVGDGVIVPMSGVTMPWRHDLPKATK